MFGPPPKWEYKTVSVLAEVPKAAQALGTDYEKVSDASVPLDDDSLSRLGGTGWELVATFLEHRTEHPNFGRNQYVTGLQPNVRPQRLVLLYKKRVPFSAAF